MENIKKTKTNDTHLKNIAELTEEYNDTIKYSAVHKQLQSKIEKPAEERQKMGFFAKYLLCFNYLLLKCKKTTKKRQFDINESEMTKEVEKIKKRKSKIQPLIPPNTNHKVKTLVLDLDETLIHTSFKKTKNYDFTLQIQVKDQLEKVYVTKRFGLDIFLFEMSQLYELVIFTAGMKDYTDKVMEIIDPKKRIKHVLYRQQCTILNKSYFLKNMKLLGRNLKQTILVDDNSMAGLLNPEIFYKIEPFYGDSRDRKLLRLIQFFKMMSKEEDFQCLCQKRKQFESKNPKTTSYLNHNINGKSLADKQNIKSQFPNGDNTDNSTLNKTEEEGSTAVQLIKGIEME